MNNRKYYYLKLKENFFDSDSMVLLENMEDGYLYSNILLKLYLRSLKDDGRLMLNGTIPYNVQMLASVTRHQVKTIEKALDIFKELGLIEVLDSGAIYMMDIQNFIGESSNEADRKRKYRARIENEKIYGQMSDQVDDKCPDKNPPDKEIRVREDKELDNTLYNSLTLKGDNPLPSADAGSDHPPFTFMDCQQCAEEGKVNLSENGIEAFYKRMRNDGWRIKGEPVSNLLLAMRGYAKNHKKYQRKIASEDEEPAKQQEDSHLEPTVETPEEDKEPSEEEYMKWLEKIGYKSEEE